MRSETSAAGENAESKEESASGAENEKAETAAEGVPTASRYLALKQDMSYEEVKKIFGAEGKAGAAKGSYTWSDADGMKLVTVAFDNDKLISISQIGVIENKDAKVTLEAYNKLNPELCGGQGNFRLRRRSGQHEFHCRSDHHELQLDQCRRLRLCADLRKRQALLDDFDRLTVRAPQAES